MSGLMISTLIQREKAQPAEQPLSPTLPSPPTTNTGWRSFAPPYIAFSKSQGEPKALTPPDAPSIPVAPLSPSKPPKPTRSPPDSGDTGCVSPNIGVLGLASGTVPVMRSASNKCFQNMVVSTCGAVVVPACGGENPA